MHAWSVIVNRSLLITVFIFDLKKQQGRPECIVLTDVFGVVVNLFLEVDKKKVFINN